MKVQTSVKQTANHPDTLRLGLVDGAGLLEAIFPDPRSRPSARWLRKLRIKRQIPCVKIGHRFVRYDVGDVEAALKKQFSRAAKWG